VSTYRLLHIQILVVKHADVFVIGLSHILYCMYVLVLVPPRVFPEASGDHPPKHPSKHPSKQPPKHPSKQGMIHVLPLRFVLKAMYVGIRGHMGHIGILVVAVQDYLEDEKVKTLVACPSSTSPMRRRLPTPLFPTMYPFLL